jgi:hypothetical protein
MSEQLRPTAGGKVSLSGSGLINSPDLNKGTAFPDRERELQSSSAELRQSKR